MNPYFLTPILLAAALAAPIFAHAQVGKDLSIPKTAQNYCVTFVGSRICPDASDAGQIKKYEGLCHNQMDSVHDAYAAGAVNFGEYMDKRVWPMLARNYGDPKNVDAAGKKNALLGENIGFLLEKMSPALWHMHKSSVGRFVALPTICNRSKICAWVRCGRYTPMT